MEFGIFGVGQVGTDPVTGATSDENEVIQATVRRAVHAEAVGLDVFAIGEHHNPPFTTSAGSTVLAYVAARTSTITLSTSTTLITTNDPVRIAEEFATLQHLAGPRVDLMMGRGNTPEVYPWFGQDARQGIPLAIENYGLLRRLWDEDVVDWSGTFRAPLKRFTSIPRPLDGVPPFVWHGSIRSPEIAEQAAYYGDGFFVNNLFMSVGHFADSVRLYRERFAHHGHGSPEEAVVGAGAFAYIRKNSQDAVREFAPYYNAHPGLSSVGTIEEANDNTGLIVGSPAQVVDKVMRFREQFGDYQRQLFAVELDGLPEQAALDTVSLLGSDVLPQLRADLGTPGRDAVSGSTDERARRGQPEPAR